MIFLFLLVLHQIGILLLKSLGTTKDKLLLKLVDALRNPKLPKMVDKAPCQEVVIKNPDIR